MNYYFGTVVKGKNFEETIELVKEELGKEGFGFPSDIDMQDIFKKKINVNYTKYRILGACNPKYAHLAVQHEPEIGVLLPCSVIVRETTDGDIEIAAVNPVVSMMSVGNDNLKEIATEIQQRLERAVKRIT
jgi:uncharacterized protein (DUF302 family)